MKFKNLGIFMLCVAMLVSTSASVRAWAESVTGEEEAYSQIYSIDGTAVAGATLNAIFVYHEPDYVYASNYWTDDYWATILCNIEELELVDGGQPNDYAYASTTFRYSSGRDVLYEDTISIYCDVYGDVY